MMHNIYSAAYYLKSNMEDDVEDFISEQGDLPLFGTDKFQNIKSKLFSHKLSKRRHKKHLNITSSQNNKSDTKSFECKNPHNTVRNNNIDWNTDILDFFQKENQKYTKTSSPHSCLSASLELTESSGFDAEDKIARPKYGIIPIKLTPPSIDHNNKLFLVKNLDSLNSTNIEFNANSCKTVFVRPESRGDIVSCLSSSVSLLNTPDPHINDAFVTTEHLPGEKKSSKMKRFFQKFKYPRKSDVAFTDSICAQSITEDERYKNYRNLDEIIETGEDSSHIGDFFESNFNFPNKSISDKKNPINQFDLFVLFNKGGKETSFFYPKCRCQLEHPFLVTTVTNTKSEFPVDSEEQILQIIKHHNHFLNTGILDRKNCKECHPKSFFNYSKNWKNIAHTGNDQSGSVYAEKSQAEPNRSRIFHYHFNHIRKSKSCRDMQHQIVKTLLPNSPPTSFASTSTSTSTTDFNSPCTSTLSSSSSPLVSCSASNLPYSPTSFTSSICSHDEKQQNHNNRNHEHYLHLTPSKKAHYKEKFLSQNKFLTSAHIRKSSLIIVNSDISYFYLSIMRLFYSQGFFDYNTKEKRTLKKKHIMKHKKSNERDQLPILKTYMNESSNNYNSTSKRFESMMYSMWNFFFWNLISHFPESTRIHCRVCRTTISNSWEFLYFRRDLNNYKNQVCQSCLLVASSNKKGKCIKSTLELCPKALY